MMRKVGAILSGLAMAVSFIFLLRFLLATDHAAGGYVIVPVLTFACALAIYTGHITGPWPRSLTWLLNCVVAMTFVLMPDWHYVLSRSPMYFVALALVSLTAILNAILLYPRSPKANKALEPMG